MKIIEKLKEINVFRDSDGNPSAQKGTTCNVIEDGGGTYVEKQWVSGDWVFSGDYEYRVEKHIYQGSNALGLPVPRLLDFDDADRKLRIEYTPGSRPKTPCGNMRLLLPVLQFYDQFKNIAFPSGPELHKMDESCIHKYRLDQLQFIFPEEGTWSRLDALYESFLRDIPYFTLPFDRILHNALLHDEGLFFVDFEWTIAGPHEFTLARIAVEFNRYDYPEIVSRVDDLNLYHLFLLRFYMYGREPKSMHQYMQQHLRNETLRELFGIVNVEKYTDEPWLST
ncbi:MAG TPA: hypothetical protein ENH84_05935 [Phycisphaerae bacterium]|uniref:Aminoglycoside phosphotransferase domain-containing protein n=1 Tax=marine sediment metagenome TaxID=412755 RepID=A0A0F9CNY4_9ZZZZ|nr:hypothetical protein [Phycisphaerae bacterium]